MKASEAEIEKILRNPPGFTPPAGLKERLVEGISMRREDPVARSSIVTRPRGGWLRRWWVALAPAAVSVACAVVLTVQNGQIRDLKASDQASVQAAATVEANATQAKNSAVKSASTESSADFQPEIDRLRELATKLKGEIMELQQLQSAENPKLRAQLATPTELALTADEAESLANAKERALRIACVNNLKQFGLAVRVYALDNNDSNPPNVVCMSNELSTPKILVCPADTNRQAAADFFSFSMANCSYEFLAPGEVTDKEPQRVLSRCPIHGNIGLCDGSVQSSVAKDHPDWLVERDGKVYYEHGRNALTPTLQNSAAPAPNSSGNTAEEQMKKFRERYGIWPTNEAAPNQSP